LKVAGAFSQLGSALTTSKVTVALLEIVLLDPFTLDVIFDVEDRAVVVTDMVSVPGAGCTVRVSKAVGEASEVVGTGLVGLDEISIGLEGAGRIEAIFARHNQQQDLEARERSSLIFAGPVSEVSGVLPPSY